MSFSCRGQWLDELETALDDNGRAYYEASKFLYVDSVAAREMWGEFVESERMEHVSHVMYRRKSHRGKYINIGADRNRETWTRTGPHGRLRKKVWFFGGSTMWGTGAESDSATIPSLVCKELTSLCPEVNWVGVNFGESGFASTTELVQLALALRADSADAIVFCDGVNDCQNAIQNGDPSVEANYWTNKYILENKQDPDDAWLKTVFVLRKIGILPSRRKFMAAAAASDSTLAAQVSGTLIRTWASAKRLAEASGATFLAVYQPSASTGKYGELLGESIAGTKYGRCLREVGREVSSKLSSESWFSDLSDIMPTDSVVYYDHCHTSSAGNTVIAKAIAVKLVSILACP